MKLPKRKSKKLQFPSSLPKDKTVRLQILHSFFLAVVAQRRKKDVAELEPNDFVVLGEEVLAIQKLFNEVRYGKSDSLLDNFENRIKSFWRQS